MNSNKTFHEVHQIARLSSKVANDCLKEYGLYHAQWSILYCLMKNGQMIQTDIWRYLNVEAPTVTRTLTRLEESGWVVRKHGRDKRERLVELTDKAKELLPEIEKNVQRAEKRLLEKLTETEQLQLINLLKKINS
ncbi:MarR family winged helix-turn-helix transcriptional regulator [Pseudalkalibacillus caeni]|uniref:MarR family transcriptional regulator n=1 Tax=Exobacillus caeni TaxID=2574798 RepID=A0A5R9FC11_9BACL|nr:MarR family transcriptional regulator [Pseudalkalibacillus caeni]TLS37185.1 MarR family transcriptional regulator [Pseudalkalibacillus caeni]